MRGATVIYSGKKLNIPPVIFRGEQLVANEKN